MAFPADDALRRRGRIRGRAPRRFAKTSSLDPLPNHRRRPCGGSGQGGCADDSLARCKIATRRRTLGDKLHALIGQFPFEPKVSFPARLGFGRDDGNDQGAFADLPADVGVPGIAALQFALMAIFPTMMTGNVIAARRAIEKRARLVQGLRPLLSFGQGLSVRWNFRGFMPVRPTQSFRSNTL